MPAAQVADLREATLGNADLYKELASVLTGLIVCVCVSRLLLPPQKKKKTNNKKRDCCKSTAHHKHIDLYFLTLSLQTAR